MLESRIGGSTFWILPGSGLRIGCSSCTVSRRSIARRRPSHGLRQLPDDSLPRDHARYRLRLNPIAERSNGPCSVTPMKAPSFLGVCTYRCQGLSNYPQAPQAAGLKSRLPRSCQRGRTQTWAGTGLYCLRISFTALRGATLCWTPTSEGARGEDGPQHRVQHNMSVDWHS